MVTGSASRQILTWSVACLVIALFAQRDVLAQPYQLAISESDVLLRDIEETKREVRLALISSPTNMITPSYQEKFVTDLRNTRSSASKLFPRIRSSIQNLRLGTQQVEVVFVQIKQRMLARLSEADIEHDAEALPTAEELEEKHRAKIEEQKAAVQLLREVRAGFQPFRDRGVDVLGEKEKWQAARRQTRLPSSVGREAGRKALSELDANLISLFDKEEDAESENQTIAKAISALVAVTRQLDEIKGNRSALSKIDTNTRALERGESDLSYDLDRIDEKFVAKALDTSGRDFYTSISTIVFGVAVIVVIVYFFRLANNDSVRLSLFQNDSGLQFVTLFSIVIAIILFGVLKILEGRELSALLGGLSGYILGRGSISGSKPAIVAGQEPNRLDRAAPPAGPAIPGRAAG